MQAVARRVVRAYMRTSWAYWMWKEERVRRRRKRMVGSGYWVLGIGYWEIGDWEIGRLGDWGALPVPSPQSPVPNIRTIHAARARVRTEA
jgi:uncharacterized protein HemY